jgi:hypothetical protein
MMHAIFHLLYGFSAKLVFKRWGWVGLVFGGGHGCVEGSLEGGYVVCVLVVVVAVEWVESLILKSMDFIFKRLLAS